MKIKKVNLADKFDSFEKFWQPKIVGDLNGQLVKIAKFKGDFITHHHENEDELFLVISGVLFIELDNTTLELHPGEFVIIPRGTSHRPYAPNETRVLLFEPNTTLNTGNVENERTIRDLDTL